MKFASELPDVKHFSVELREFEGRMWVVLSPFNLAICFEAMDQLVQALLLGEDSTVVHYGDLRACANRSFTVPRLYDWKQVVTFIGREVSADQLFGLVEWWLQNRFNALGFAGSLIADTAERLRTRLIESTKHIRRDVLLLDSICKGSQTSRNFWDPVYVPTLSVEICFLGPIEVQLNSDGESFVVEHSYFDAFIRGILTALPGGKVGSGKLDSSMPYTYDAEMRIGSCSVSVEELFKLASWWVSAADYFGISDILSHFSRDYALKVAEPNFIQACRCVA